MVNSYSFDLRGAIDEEIRKALSELVSRLTPTKPKMGVSGYSCGGLLCLSS